MAICSNCGATNPADAGFCMRCGGVLPEGARGGETRKTVTIVFADVSGFTKLAAGLDPESVRSLMARYFDDMSGVLRQHGGLVEKFAGDAVMAVFGIPSLHEDDALRAVRAVFAMKDALKDLNDDLNRRWGVVVEFHAGINTGEIVTGEEANVRTFATGQPVNIAARLQSAAGPGEILIGTDTYRLVRDAVDAEMLPPLELRNHPSPITAYRLKRVVDDAGLVAPLHSPLIGRGDELPLLLAAFEDAVANRECRVVTVLGEAGIGKSRLADEVVRSVTGEPIVLSGRCLSYGGGIALWPVVEVVGQATRITEDDVPETVHAKLLAAVEGETDAELIAKRVSAAMGITRQTHGIEQLFWGFRRFLESRAQKQPLVVVFDDLHWAEPVFLDMIEYLAVRTRNAPILIVCLARPQLLEIRPSWLDADISGVVLEPLAEGDSETLIESLLGERGLPAETRRWIVETSRGNPLFVQEILRMMIDEGFLDRAEGGWALVRDVSLLTAPPTIQALLAARLDSLSNEEKSVLQRASVIGQVFWWGAVAELSEAGVRPRVGVALQSLVRRQFLHPCDSSFVEEDAFRFVHILIRDAAYQATPKGLRADLHERFASWLERKAEARITEYEEIIGHHLEQAYRYGAELAGVDQQAAETARRAASFLVPAAQRAYERGDVPSALNLYERAEVLLAEDEGTRLKILPDLGAALTDSGELERADALLTHTISQAKDFGDTTVESYAALEQLRLRIFNAPGSTLDDARRHVRKTIFALEELNDDLGLARAWNLLGCIHSYRGKIGAAEDAWDRAVEYAQDAGSPVLITQTLALLADTLDFGPTPVDDAIDRCAEIIDIAGGDQKVTASVLVSRAALEAMRGAFDGARRDVAVGRQLYVELGLNVLAANSAQNLGFIEMLAGDAVAAEREFRSGYIALTKMGESGYLATVGGQLAHALIALQRDHEAEQFAQQTRTAAAPDDASAQALWRTAEAKLMSARGEFEDAERLAREAIAITEETDWLNYRADAQMDLAVVLRRAGRVESAAEAIQSALGLYGRKGNTASLRSATERLEALLRGGAPSSTA